MINLLPNEILRQTLSHLSRQQLLSVIRVSSLWKFLINSGLIQRKALQEESFFGAEIALEKLTDPECIALERQQAVYADLATQNRISLTSLKREHLKAFSVLNQGQVDTPKTSFLKRLVIASSIVDGVEYDRETFLLMAKIGNLQKLKAWSEKYKANINNADKQWAACAAARYGQIECLEYLIQTYGAILGEDNGLVTLNHAVRHGHLACVKYLVEKYKQSISEGGKEWMLQWAIQYNHSGVEQYLKEYDWGSTASDEKSLSLIFSDINVKDESVNAEKDRRKVMDKKSSPR